MPTGAKPSTRIARAERDQRTLDVSDQSNGSQGQLFSDAAVGAPAYDEVDTDLVGYRGPTACRCGHHLPAARLLGPYRPGGTVGPHRDRLGHAAAVLLPRHPGAEGGQATAGHRRLAAEHPQGGRPPPQPRHQGPRQRHCSPTAPPSTSAPRPRRSSTCWPVARASSASLSPVRSASCPASWPSCRPSGSTAVRSTRRTTSSRCAAASASPAEARFGVELPPAGSAAPGKRAEHP